MLAKIEENVKSRIQKSDTPFLGLLREAFTESERLAIEILTLANSNVEGYIGFLSRFPALFSVNLTAHIMEGMGQSGHFQLYPHIQRAIGTESPLSQVERDKLWRAFRKAILTLGFEPSPRIFGNHFMADEYLRQVGVPLAFADDLAQKMLGFAKRVGLPDEDDVEAIRSWQQALDSRLEAPFSVTARKAVVLDTDAYYTRAFLRVYYSLQQHGEIAGKNALEKAMAKAFEKQAKSNTFRRAVLPYIVLNDGTVGVFIPGGEERDFEFCIDNEIRHHRSGMEDRFVALSNPLTKDVTIKDLSSSQVSQYRLWEDSKPNRIVIFSNNGRLKAPAQLNQTEVLILPPGNYNVLSRFSPSEVEADELWDEPALYGFMLQVHPGKEVTLSNGPGKLTLQGEIQPCCSWIGKSKTSKDGVDFHFGNLQFLAEFPLEWTTFSGRHYELRLSATALGKSIQLPFSINELGTAQVSVSEAVEGAGWKPGFGRILAEVFRKGENRSLLRSSTFFWHGLADIKPGPTFICTSLPANIAKQLNENVEVKDKLFKPKDRQSRTFRLAFKLDEKRHQTLTWNLPGVFIEVENISATGDAIRFNKSIGAVEVVTLTSNKQILISSSEPATLELGDWCQHVDFVKFPTKRISASFLCSKLAAGRNTLTLKPPGTAISLDLLRLVQPHFVQKMTVKLWGGQFVVKFDVPKELEAVRVSAVDVISGQSVEVALETNTGIWTKNSFARAQLMTLNSEDGGYCALLTFGLDVWPSGAWIFKFDGQIGGVWGHLENERQDIFAAGLIHDGEGKAIQRERLLDCLDGLTDQQSVEVLSRVQDAMLPCYALESWQTVHWLLDIWRSLLARWSERTDAAVTTLVDLAVARPPEEASSSWMLQQTVGAAIPKIFALPASSYRQVNQRPYPLVNALRAIAELQRTYPNVFGELIHPAFASAFSNLAAIIKGEIPQGFSIDRYTAALQQTSNPIEDSFKLEDANFQPGNGDWLGPVHFKFAARSIETTYDRTLGGNEIRGQALNLCRFLKQKMPNFNDDSSSRLKGKCPRLNPWPTADSDTIDELAAQRNENLEMFAHGISLFAYHCRLDARSPGKLQIFIDKLSSSGMPVEKCLAYLLQTGEAVFAYYLLCWEFVMRAERIK